MEAVRAFSALANNGKMVVPHLVSRIEYGDGTSKKIEPIFSEQVITPETAATMATMLTHVVDDAMSGGIHKMPHYTIAAKTGTAQIANETGGGYYENKYLHSFFGFFPAKNPKFLVLLFMKDPKGVNFASQTLTDPFFTLAQFLLHYYTITPDR
jgi:cell division protein FtsI/penicillin-binding protein 2